MLILCCFWLQISEHMEVFQEQDFRFRSDQSELVLVYDQAFFERFSPRTIGDLLRKLPGFSGDGDSGEFSEAQMRGLSPEYTNILINGFPVPAPNSQGILMVDRIPANLVEKIELIRNAGATFDPNGVGGTVNIILKEKAVTSFSLGSELVGAEWGGSGDLFTSFQKEGFSLEVMAGGQIRTNPKGQQAQISIFELNEEDEAQKREEVIHLSKVETNFGEKSDQSILVRMGYRFDGGSVLSYEYWATENRMMEGEDTFYYLEGELDSWEFDDGDLTQSNRGSRAQFRMPQSPIGAISIALQVHKLRLDSTNQVGVFEEDHRIVEEIERDQSKALTTVLDFRGTLLGSDNLLEYGLGFLRLDRNARQTLFLVEEGDEQDSGVFDLDIRRAFAFVSFEKKWSGDFQLKSGLRIEDYQAIHHDTHYFPSIHGLFQRNHGQWRFGFSRNVKFPDSRALTPFKERDVPRSGQILSGDPKLKPEFSWSFDTGYEMRFEKNQGVIGLNAFYRQIEDRIIIRQENEDLFRYSNDADGEVYGMELDAGFPLSMFGLPKVSVYFNASYQESETKDPFLGTKRSFNNFSNFSMNAGWTQLFTMNWQYGIHYLTQDDVKQVQLNEIADISFGDQLEFFLEKSWKSHTLRMSGSNLLQAERYENLEIFEGIWTEGDLIERQIEMETSKVKWRLIYKKVW